MNLPLYVSYAIAFCATVSINKPSKIIHLYYNQHNLKSKRMYMVRLCQVFADTHPIYIASPKEKKRYRFRIASSYAASVRSLPASADTSIIKVDSGR